MATANQPSAEILCAEILSAAHQECEEIMARAQTEAARVLANGRTAAEKIQREQEKYAKAEALRIRERILATVAVEIGRLRSNRIETQLELIHTEIRHHLTANKSANRQTIVALAAEALHRMPENNFVVQICGADREFIGDGLAGEIIQRVGRPSLNLAITSNGDGSGAGVVVRNGNGLQIWDNRLLKRLERLWPELRRQIIVQIPISGDNDFLGGMA